jgi:hypothetical protein
MSTSGGSLWPLAYSGAAAAGWRLADRLEVAWWGPEQPDIVIFLWDCQAG